MFESEILQCSMNITCEFIFKVHDCKKQKNEDIAHLACLSYFYIKPDPILSDSSQLHEEQREESEGLYLQRKPLWKPCPVFLG